MRSSKIFAFLLLVVSIQFSWSQEIEWQNTIGGNDNDQLNCIQHTIDGGFILGGSSMSNISGDKSENSNGNADYWIIKFDSLNNIEWQNTIGGNQPDYCTKIIQTPDEGYILGGWSCSTFSGDKTENPIGLWDYWVVKVNSLGVIQWQNTIGGNEYDILYTLCLTTDGGYALGGYSASGYSGDKTENCNGDYDFWIVKLDSVGNIQWQNTIGGGGDDRLYSINQTSDNGFICGGYSYSNISGDKTENSLGDSDYWIVRLDSMGNILWQNTIGGTSIDGLLEIRQTFDKGYILGGYSSSDISMDKTENSFGGNDYWILKLDSAGSIIWQETIGGDSNDWLTSIQKTNDNGFISFGTTWSNISGDKIENSNYIDDYWVLKIDSVGKIQWQNTIGGSYYDFGNSLSIASMDDGGILLGGYSLSNLSGDKSENCLGGADYWIVRLTNKYNLITGKAFADLNSNSTKDPTEPTIPNKKITEINTNRFAFSQQNGFYSVAVLDSGSFYVAPAPINYYNAVPANHSATFTGINQTDSLNDFAFQPTGVFNDLCITLTPLAAFRPGFNASYMVNYENVGTTTLTPTVKLFQSSTLSYVSSTALPAIANADSVMWSLPALSPFQSGSLVVTLNVNAAAVIGSNIYSQCVIEPIANDYNVYCNYSGVSSTITGSIDPNDILVSEDTLTTTQLATQPYLDYTIRFQNTGNDTAFTVKIINPIDTNKLELSSIEFVNASHPVNLKWVNYNRNMEFAFDNILLPDSNINEPLSHGFVHYRIKPKTTLLARDSVTNNAYIYFDFNAPVATNTAVTRIVLTTDLSTNPSPIERGTLLCYPNPAVDELNISLNNGKVNQPMTVKIFDVLGKEILKTESKTSLVRIPLSLGEGLGVRLGIYFVEVISGKEVYRAKFVKE